VQTKGKGQRGAVWISEASKNLIISVLVNDFIKEAYRMFDINIVTSFAVIEVLDELNIPGLSIKWPNDIMSYNKKIGGILIENSIKSDGSIVSIIGLGLNVNQTDFKQLPKASSLAVICNASFDKEAILVQMVEKLEEKMLLWQQNSEIFSEGYRNMLFKKGVPMPFSDKNSVHFMGIIQGVSALGKLEVMLEDDTISEFDIKEIQMLY
jgi:BirA family biotin operon repressor/biotin-[acetyl-CoA-carboxylase] ligase